jgi:hypothetical protein
MNDLLRGKFFKRCSPGEYIFIESDGNNEHLLASRNKYECPSKEEVTVYVSDKKILSVEIASKDPLRDIFEQGRVLGVREEYQRLAYAVSRMYEYMEQYETLEIDKDYSNPLIHLLSDMEAGVLENYMEKNSSNTGVLFKRFRDMPDADDRGALAYYGSWTTQGRVPPHIRRGEKTLEKKVEILKKFTHKMCDFKDDIVQIGNGKVNKGIGVLDFDGLRRVPSKRFQEVFVKLHPQKHLHVVSELARISKIVFYHE